MCYQERVGVCFHLTDSDGIWENTHREMLGEAFQVVILGS
jgi:hypothetical protein